MKKKNQKIQMILELFFYNSSGQEIDLSNISNAAYCKVSNSIMANALYNSIRMMKIKQNCSLPTDVGCYALLKESIELSDGMFNDILSVLKR